MVLHNIAFNSSFLLQNYLPAKKEIKPLKPIKSDVVSFKSTVASSDEPKYFNEADIHKTAREFSNQVVDLYRKNGRLTPVDLKNIVNSFIDTKEKIQIEHMSQYQMGAAAYCASGIDKKGNPVNALFVDFTVPVPELIESLVHEFTHILQIFTEKQTLLMEKSLSRAHDTHMQLEEAANAYEDKILYIVNEVLPRYEDQINSKLLNPSTTLESLVEAYKLVNTDMFEQGLKEISNQYKIKIDSFTLNYFLNKAQKESQAYKEGHTSLKEVNGFPDTRLTFDIIPVLYDKWGNYLKQKLAQSDSNKPFILMA